MFGGHEIQRCFQSRHSSSPKEKCGYVLHELDEKSDETHDEETRASCRCDLGKLCHNDAHIMNTKLRFGWLIADEILRASTGCTRMFGRESF